MRAALRRAVRRGVVLAIADEVDDGADRPLELARIAISLLHPEYDAQALLHFPEELAMSHVGS
jgi:hypothetical protein